MAQPAAVKTPPAADLLSYTPPTPRRGFGPLGLAVLVNLGLWLVCGMLLASHRQGLLADAQRDITTVARLVDLNVAAVLDRAAMGVVSTSLALERQLAQGAIDTTQLWETVDTQTSQIPQLARIGVFDADGHQVCGSAAARCMHLAVADRDYFQHHRTGSGSDNGNGVVLHGPHASRVDGSPTLALSRALRRPDGGFAGVVVALLPVAAVQQLLTGIDVGPHGAASLRTADLQMLARQPPLPPLADASLQRAVSPVLRDTLAGTARSGVLRTVAANDGVQRATAYRHMAGYPLVVLVGVATDDTLAGWHQLALATGLLLLLAAGASVVGVRLARSDIARRERARALYDTAPCGYHRLNADGVIVDINATELGWLGLPRAAVVGRLHLGQFLNDEGRATFARNFPRLVQGQALRDLELDLVGSDGRPRRVLVQAEPVLDAQGRFVMSNSVLQDISALHQARSQLQAQAQQQGLMLDTDLVGIALVRNRLVQWANHGMVQLFGHPAADWPQMPTRRLHVDDAAWQQHGDAVQAVIQAGRLYRAQHEMRHRDGRLLWLDVNAMRLADGSDDMLLLMSDITPLRQAEALRLQGALLASQNAQLEADNHFKGALLSNMSHEWRTPLNAVIGLTGLLRGGRVPMPSPKAEGYLDQIQQAGQQLLGHVERMLALAQLESGKLVLQPADLAPDALASLLQALVALHQAAAQAQGLQLSVFVEQDVGTVSVDAARLRQVLAGLLDNAVKFSQPGGRVNLLALGDGPQHWCVEVHDEGIGIAEADLPRLFQPFSPLDASTTKQHAGVGLGLALAQRLAQAMGGSLQVQSSVGQGSVFRLRLPRQPAGTGTP